MSLLARRRPLVVAAAVLIGIVVALSVTLAVRHTGSPSGAGPTSGSSSPTTSSPPPGSVAAAPACDGPGRTVTRPVQAATAMASQWQQVAPPDNSTYDLTGVTSTAYPATRSVFAVGTTVAGQRTCLLGGTILGRADDRQTWDLYHGSYNAACVKILARDWMQVRGLRCDNVEDGIRPEESSVNANNASVYVSGTYLTRIRDDCLENDYTLGGLLQDNLWEQCNTGVSERPSGHRSWTTPAAETLTLDHMLIGLYQTPHDENGKTVLGENALFKWSSSGNRVIIKCSTFKVDAVSLNGTDAMALPPRTAVDDSQCPDHPSTIVWLGGGDYPAPAPGLRVVTDRAVWDDAVSAWKSAHQVAAVAPAAFRVAPGAPRSAEPVMLPAALIQQTHTQRRRALT
jgi:hypothetical protein